MGTDAAYSAQPAPTRSEAGAIALLGVIAIFELVIAALDVALDESSLSEEQPTTPTSANAAAAVTARTRVEVDAFMGLPSVNEVLVCTSVQGIRSRRRDGWVEFDRKFGALENEKAPEFIGGFLVSVSADRAV